MTFDLARLKGYVGKLADEQNEELDKALKKCKKSRILKCIKKNKYSYGLERSEEFGER